jgi:hypothetical protein
MGGDRDAWPAWPAPDGPAAGRPRRAARWLLAGGLLAGALLLAGVAWSAGRYHPRGAPPAAAAATTSAPAAAPGTETSLDALGPGDCVQLPPAGVVTTVDVVAYGQPHDGEVYATFDEPNGPWAGDEAVARAAEAGCLARFRTYVGRAARDSRFAIAYFAPREANWDEGNTTVTCALRLDGGGRLVGSAQLGRLAHSSGR